MMELTEVVGKSIMNGLELEVIKNRKGKEMTSQFLCFILRTGLWQVKEITFWSRVNFKLWGKEDVKWKYLKMKPIEAFYIINWLTGKGIKEIEDYLQFYLTDGMC